jgi:hypothetical protein
MLVLWVLTFIAGGMNVEMAGGELVAVYRLNVAFAELDDRIAFLKMTQAWPRLVRYREVPSAL